jgi:uncharacterized membrane-anchored protein YitT (DUF2179 family)
LIDIVSFCLFHYFNFILGTALTMIRTQITILANTVCIICPVRVWTLISKFFAASLVVTIFTHTLRVKSEACVRTRRNKLFLDSIDFFLFRFVTLLSSPSRQIRTSARPSINSLVRLLLGLLLTI